jgi:uncharacterized protein YaaW (UPF0174 family)
MVQQVLNHADQDELLTIAKIFNPEAKSPSSPNEIGEKICEAGGHVIGNWLRSQGVPYTQFLSDVAKFIKIDTAQSLNAISPNGLKLAEMDARALNPTLNSDVSSNCKWQVDDFIVRQEQEILKKFTENIYQHITPEQKIEVDKRIRDFAKTAPGISTRGLGTSAAFIAAASAGGFAPYMLLSTVISTVTGGMAGFGVYTAASSALHVLIGPAGWAALGAAAIYKIGGPNQQKCLKAALAIALLRGKLEQTTLQVIR